MCLDIHKTFLQKKALAEVLHKCFRSTARSVHSISVEHNQHIRWKTKVLPNQFNWQVILHLKQSDNILYACFVCSSLLWLGRSVGVLDRFAYRTVSEGIKQLKYICSASLEPMSKLYQISEALLNNKSWIRNHLV